MECDVLRLRGGYVVSGEDKESRFVRCGFRTEPRSSAASLNLFVPDHGYFAGSSTGKFAVFKGTNPGAFLWEASFDSPVIGVYLREGDRLVSVPFTTMDDNSVPFRGLDPTRQYKLS